MKNFIPILVVIGCAIAFMAADKTADATVSTPSVQLFTPLAAVDSASSHYFLWENDAVRAGTVHWLLDFEKALTDSAATMVITVQQSAQIAPFRNVTQRWYTTDTIAILSGKVATPRRWLKDNYSPELSGRAVRLRVHSTDNHNLTAGRVDMLFKPD